MHYLFTPKRNKDAFLKEFYRIKKSIKNGTTPVYCELRSAKTQLSEISMLVILLAVNTATSTLSYCLWTIIKHSMRVRRLKGFGLDVTENIAVLESMEYQTV